MSGLLALVVLTAATYVLYRIFDDSVVAGISIWKAARDESREERFSAISGDTEGSPKPSREKESSGSR